MQVAQVGSKILHLRRAEIKVLKNGASHSIAVIGQAQNSQDILNKVTVYPSFSYKRELE